MKAGESRVLVLKPAFIHPQDRHEKQERKRAAIPDEAGEAFKRWVNRNAGRYDRYRHTFSGDDIYACQPICELCLESGFSFILACKPDSHISLQEQVDFFARQGVVKQLLIRQWNGRVLKSTNIGLSIRPLWVARRCIGSQIVANVREGRAHWKRENETNTVLTLSCGLCQGNQGLTS